MRILKTLLIIVLAIVAIVVLLGLIGADTYHVDRSTVINATPEQVYPYVSNLSSQQAWGPWQEQDRDAKNSLEGTDGTVGAVWSWDGDTIGKGKQEITSLEANKSVRTKLTFYTPMKSEGTGSFDLEPTAEGTKVTWGMEGKNGFLGKLMSKFMNMDDMLGPMFDTGLANMKTMVEKEAAEANAALAAKTFNGYVIETIEYPATVFVGKRNRKVKWTEFENFYGSNFAAVGGAMGAMKLEMNGHPSGIFYAWDEQGQTADVMAAMPVKADPSLTVPGMDVLAIPACKMLMTPYFGAYDDSGKAHEAMDAMIKANSLEHYGNVIEEYVTDPTSEKDTTKWLTNIYYMVR